MAAGNRFKPNLTGKPVPDNDIWAFLVTPLVMVGIILMSVGIRCSRTARWIMWTCRQMFS